MKTLVIIPHSDMRNSVINKRWINEQNKYPEKYVVHHLYQVYPDEKIDVAHEQSWSLLSKPPSDM